METSVIENGKGVVKFVAGRRFPLAALQNHAHVRVRVAIIRHPRHPYHQNHHVLTQVLKLSPILQQHVNEILVIVPRVLHQQRSHGTSVWRKITCPDTGPEALPNFTTTCFETLVLVHQIPQQQMSHVEDLYKENEYLPNTGSQTLTNFTTTCQRNTCNCPASAVSATVPCGNKCIKKEETTCPSVGVPGRLQQGIPSVRIFLLSA